MGTLAFLGAIAACSSSSSTTPGTGGSNAGTGGGAGADGSVGTGGSTDAGADAPSWGPILGTASVISQTQYNFVSLEGPYWVASGKYLLFSDVVEKNMTGSLIYKYDPASNMFSVYPYPTAMPADTNGLGVDSKGQLVATERYNHQVTRVEGTTLKVLASMYMGKPLDAPNDLVIDSSDNIYFTDTHYGSITPDAMLIPTGAYRISADGATLTKIWEAGPDPLKNSMNGIAFSKDGKSLYLGDDTANTVIKVPLGADGLVPTGTTPVVLIKQSSIPGDRMKVPDGINIDDDGNIYVAVNHHDTNAVAVFGEDGTYKGRYDVPVGIDTDPDGGAPLDPAGKGPSNISFGGDDRKTMYITTLHAIYKVAVPTAGKP
ncbi:MAG TPA: SMP-30/gluconolactonase/LRE family protein [Polyangia bacterium]|nr:SMP-30/gluconolactonase/LRE family protein [Polyangia bacterium]